MHGTDAPDLSVVIPTHNRRVLLGDTMASVLAERDVNFEVIVVDDDSDDGTTEWLDSLTDRRVRPIRVSPGRGGSAARNVGFSEVRSPYVMYLDDDDILCRHALPRLLRAANRHPEAAGSGGTYVSFGATDVPHRQPTTRVPLVASIWREQLWGWNLQPGAGLWRSSVVRQMNGWDESLRRCEDLDFNLRSYPRPLALVPTTVTYYRYHAGQVDAAVQKLSIDLAAEVRAQFVAGLVGPDREVGEQILRSRPMFDDGLAAYGAAEWRQASSAFISMFRAAPCLARSPILGPWLLGLLAKSLGAAALPGPVHRVVRQHRTARRLRKLAAISPR